MQIFHLSSQVRVLTLSAMMNPTSPQAPSFISNAHSAQSNAQPNAHIPFSPGFNPQPMFAIPPPHLSQPHPFPGPSSSPHPFQYMANGQHVSQIMNNGYGSGPPSGVTSPNLLSPLHDYHPSIASARFRSSSSSSSLGSTDDAEETLNEELAEAILKRPESIRSPVSSSSSSGSRSESVVGRATKDGFTFASLSDLGNPQNSQPSHQGIENESGTHGQYENPDSEQSPDSLSANEAWQISPSMGRWNSAPSKFLDDDSSTPRTAHGNHGDPTMPSDQVPLQPEIKQ